MSDNTISRERLEAPPGAVYTETILEPSYRFMLEHYFQPLVETNKAWMVMLAETEIVDRETAAALLDAILDLEAEGPDALREFDPRYEYFYSHMEHFLIERVGEEIAGGDQHRPNATRASGTTGRSSSTARPVGRAHSLLRHPPRPRRARGRDGDAAMDAFPARASVDARALFRRHRRRPRA